MAWPNNYSPPAPSHYPVMVGYDSTATTTGGNSIPVAVSPTNGAVLVSLAGSTVTSNTIYPDRTSTGTLTTVGDIVTIDVSSGYNSVGIELTGTFTGAAIAVEESVGGNRFDSMTVYTTGGSQTLTSISNAGNYQGLTASMLTFRVRLTAISSGTVNVTLRASRSVSAVMLDNPLPTQSGSNIIGGVTVAASSNNIGKVNILDSAGNLLSSSNSRLLVDAGLYPAAAVLNTYSAQVSTNTTTTPTAVTSFISSIAISVTSAGTTSTLTIKDKQGTPLTLVNLLPTATLSAGDTIFNFQTPVKMVSGIDIITAGAAAATVSIFMNYYQ